MWSQLSAPARYQKKKVWTDPRFRHVGSIGKFVPCFEEDGEPTLQDRIDVLLQPVAAGVRGDHRDCVDALVETFMDVFAKHKKRDHILREFFLKNDGKLRGYECIGTRPIAPKRFTSDVEKLGGPNIKLDKDEDREKSIRRFSVTLYQNIAGRRKPPSGSLEQSKLAKLQEEQAEYEAELPKDPLQRIRESILRDRPPRVPRSNRTKRLITDIQSHSRVMLDDDDLPNSELLLDEGGRDRPRRYCCEKHAWRALGRVADLAEAHRDMCCREVELALDRCSTFSPSHDELRDFVGTLLERRAVVERNGQAWRDPVADKKASLAKSGGLLEDDKSKNIKDMAQRSTLCGNQTAGAPRHRRDVAPVTAAARWRGGSRISLLDVHAGARQLVAADESAQDEMAAHLKKVDKGALEQGADFYKATSVEVEKATRVPRILEDDEDQRKQLVRDVATCLKCAERPFVPGSLPDACTYDPGTLAARCGAVAARLVVEQALPQEQDAVFELLRRRTAVVHDPNREDDTKVKPTSGSYDAWARHCRTVDKYLYYRDSFQLNDAMSYDDDVPSEAESAPEE